MVGAPAKTGSSTSGSLPDVLAQLGADVRKRLAQGSRSSGSSDIEELESRLKARLDSHQQRLSALEEASPNMHAASKVGSQMAALHAAVQNVARENNIRRSPRKPGESPPMLTDSPQKPGAVTPPMVDENMRVEIQSDITRHLEILRVEVEQQLAGEFASRLDALRHEVDRRLLDMNAALESVSQNPRPSSMPALALPPQATDMEKAAWSEGWRAGQLKALQVTSPEFGPSDSARERPQQQISSSRNSESSSHPLMSAIEPSPHKSTPGRRSLTDDHSAHKSSSRSGDQQESQMMKEESGRSGRDKHWL